MTRPPLRLNLGPCVIEEAAPRQVGLGAIFSAVDEQTAERETWKIVPKSSVNRVKKLRTLHREMRLQAQLQHPNVAKLLGVAHGPSHVLLRFEQAPSSNLAEILRASGRGLLEDRARRLQSKLANAVAYCHAQGVAHRDLQPENILLDAPGRNLKISNFACCVPTGSQRSDVAGTFPFMAPEVCIASSLCAYEPAGVASNWGSQGVGIPPTISEPRVRTTKRTSMIRELVQRTQLGGHIWPCVLLHMKAG